MSAHLEKRLLYTEWMKGQHLRYNFDVEVPNLADRVSHGVQNDTPPKELWEHILPTLRLVEKVRERFGPTTIHSAYRSKAYNVAVYEGTGKPATDSQHSCNTAIDFSCQTGTPKQWLAFLRQLRNAKTFKGGLGLYNTFVHVDTRGSNADWG